MQTIQLEPFEESLLQTNEEGFQSGRIRWFRMILLFSCGFVASMISGLSSNPNTVFAATAILVSVGLLMLRPWELFILVYTFATLDHLVIWLSPGTNVYNEPVFFKLVKDLLVLGLFLSVLRIHTTFSRRFFLTYTLFAAYMLLRGLADLAVIGEVAVILRYFTFYPLVGMLFMGAYDRIEKMTTCLRIYVVISLIVVFVGVVEISTSRVSFYSGYVSFGPIQQRMVSTLGNPNNLAMFLQVPLLYLISGIFMKTYRSKMHFIPLICIIGGMFLTFSRTAYIAALCGVLFMSGMMRNLRTIFLSLFVACILFIGFLILQGGRVEGGLFESRIEMLKAFLSQSLESGEYLLFGQGLGSSDPSVSRFSDEKLYAGTVTDNTYTDILTRAGVIGLILFMLFIASLTCACIRVWWHITVPSTKRVYLTLMSWNMVFLVYSVAAHAFILYPSVLFYWVSAFWILSLPSIDSRVSQEDYLIEKSPEWDIES